MPTVAVYNMEGEPVGELALSDQVFGVEPNPALLHQVVVARLANERQGTADTKTRGEVSGGGRKPWRQKGTGRARHGSIRSPLWRKGGVVFGPTPRDYTIRLPQKLRRAALRAALSSKVAAGDFLVLDQLSISEPKTRTMASVLKSLKAKKKALIVLDTKDPNVTLASRNIPGVRLSPSATLNAYEVLDADTVLITRDAVAQVEEALS